MYFDTHAHYDDKSFREDRGALLGADLAAAGVSRVINVGADMRSSAASVKLAHDYPYILATVGVHPHYVKHMVDDDLNLLLKMSKDAKVVAVGEIGLDFYRDLSPRDVQRRRFLDQLELAKAAKLPVVIHSRSAGDEVYNILREHASALVGGVIHCFGDGPDMALAYAKLGFFVAFGGAITFPKAAETVRAAQALPMEHMLLETDCPYIAPVPIRGQRNDSRALAYICQKMAEIKALSHDECARITHENAVRFCQLGGKFAVDN